MILLCLKSNVEFEMLTNNYGHGIVEPKEYCVFTKDS
jgi:hypothetical protein